MNILVKSILAAVAGLILGLWSTLQVLSHGDPFDEVALGPWRLATKAGAPDADPYRRADLERSGEIPLALGEGIQLVARIDDSGRVLDPRCSYRIGPRTPAARYWTLSAVDAEGFAIANPAERYVLRSSEILRREDGSFDIHVSGISTEGNWLPVPTNSKFAMVLRLYDSPLGAAASEIEKASAPSITRESCA